MHWGVRRAARRRFTEPAKLNQNPAHLARLGVYLGDMLRPYGMELPEGAAGASQGQSYGEMAEALIAEVLEPGEQVDLLVLAFAIPDVTPGRATATYLSHVCPGNPMAFAICDQGAAGAFTGLRLLSEYARDPAYRRSLLLIAEQDELLYDPGLPTVRPAGNAAVAVLFGDSDSAVTGVSVRRSAGEFTPPEADVLVLGRELAATSGPARLAPEGQPFTGVWWELAEELGKPWQRLVLADSDPQLGYLCTAVIENSRDLT
jgi:hypothetical protein